MKRESFKQEVYRLLECGVEQYGTRNDAQVKLIIYYRRLGYTEKECVKAIRDWYRTFPHCSIDWEKNPKRVLKNVEGAVRPFYRGRRQGNLKPPIGSGASWKPLRMPDASKITKISRDYRMQKSLFSLLLYIKNHMNKNREFRLPSRVIPKFDCCSTETYKKKMRFWEARGLIVKTKECSEMERRARTYRVNFDFSDDGEFISSLEAGLISLFPEKILRRRYSRWVFNNYLRNLPKELKCNFPKRFRESKNPTENNNPESKSLIHFLLPVPERKAVAPADRPTPQPKQPLLQTPAVPLETNPTLKNPLSARYGTLPPSSAIIPFTLHHPLQDPTKSQHRGSTDAGVRRHRSLHARPCSTHPPGRQTRRKTNHLHPPALAPPELAIFSRPSKVTRHKTRFYIQIVAIRNV